MELTLLKNNNLQKRAERLAAAIFLVSNVMSDTEILKTKIRQLSVDLVSSSLRVMDTDGAQVYHALRSVKKNVSELLSLLTVTSVAGLISDMNASILKTELDAFLGQVVESEQAGSFSSNVSKDFFVSSASFDKEVQSVKDNAILPRYVSSRTPDLHKPLSEKDKLTRKDQRTKAIMNLMSKLGEVSIKDISSSIKGCSEKTVQRELNAMIAEGIVKKTGERRWSRYSLAR